MFPGRTNEEYSISEIVGVFAPYDPDKATRSSNFTSDGPQYGYMLKEDGRYHNHYSFYIMPDGGFLDCRQPLRQSDTKEYNLQELPRCQSLLKSQLLW